MPGALVVRFLTFASLLSGHFCECQNQRTTSKYSFWWSLGFDIRFTNSQLGLANVKSTPLACTHGPVYNKKKYTSVVTTGKAGHHSIPCAMVLRFIPGSPW